MFKEVVVATKNQGKLKEFIKMFKELNIAVRSLNEFENIPDIEETGKTFEENARIKAEYIRDLLNLPTVADDSGLMVDYLNGQPGIYSARFAGEDKNDKINNEKLLSMLVGVDEAKRTAKFVSAIAIAVPNEETVIAKGTVSGVISLTPKGNNGFGYDPLFYLPEYQKTMAELTPEQKNKISHRANALENLRKKIHKYFL